MPADLLAAMEVRFRTYNEGGQEDTSLMLSPEATEQARSLWEQESTPNGNIPMRARQALAWFHWARYMARPAGEDFDDVQAAMIFFAPVFLAAPKEVPDTVFECLISTSPAAIIDNSRYRADEPESYVARTYQNALEYAMELSQKNPDIISWGYRS